jgi:HK97 family phage major capsid protein
MTKEELEAKRRARAEAHKAFKKAVEDYKAGRPGDSPISAEEWLEKATEQLRKARAAFVELQNELIGIDAQQDLAKADSDYDAWQKRPATRLPQLKDPADAKLNTPETYQSRLEREAFALEKASAGHRTQQTTNTITMYRNELETYVRLGLNADESQAYKEFFGATIRYGSQDGRLHQAAEKLKAVVGMEKFALLSSQGETGGYLVDDDFQASVIRDLVGFSVFRQVARVARTGKDVMVFPTVKAPTAANAKKGFPARWAGDWGAQADQAGNSTLTTQDQPTFGQERIQIHRYQPAAVEISLETLEDPDVDVSALLAELMAETRGIDENAAFTEGSGQDRPKGITNEAFTAVNSGVAAALAFNPGSNKGLLGLVGTLPPQYRQNATMMMNSLTYTQALGLENSSTSHSLVFPQPSQAMISGQQFGALMTYRVAFNEYLPNVGAGTYPIIFGDFMRGYVIADRMELRVQRLVEKVAPNIAFLAIARLGGQTVRTNCFVRQKVAA